MRFAGLLIAAAAAVSAPAAHAEILFANNFDAEHGGVPVANYTGFDGLTVVGGPINLVGPWAPVLRCVGDKGQCIELYGTPKLPASFQSTTSYSFAAGDTVTLSFDVSGNQIGLNSQTLFDGFNFTSGPTKITRSTVNGLEQGPGTVTQIALSQSVWSRNPFSTKSISFTAAQEGAISFFIGGYYFGTGGLILDNLRLQREPSGLAPVAAVPEPATWAMMLIGLGAVGGSLRRRKARTTVSYA